MSNDNDLTNATFTAHRVTDEAWEVFAAVRSRACICGTPLTTGSQDRSCPACDAIWPESLWAAMARTNDYDKALAFLLRGPGGSGL